jgi:hypothetical protein
VALELLLVVVVMVVEIILVELLEVAEVATLVVVVEELHTTLAVVKVEVEVQAFTQGNDGPENQAAGGAAVQSDDAQYESGTNKGGNGSTPATAVAGGHGSVSYSIDNGDFVTLSYSGGVVNFDT